MAKPAAEFPREQDGFHREHIGRGEAMNSKAKSPDIAALGLQHLQASVLSASAV
ncbi:MAG: hypothetical protein HY242_01365 [Afipia sp.]|nr:hypothetical protein [Afipia sp.]